jgi:hypothetical protein
MLLERRLFLAALLAAATPVTGRAQEQPIRDGAGRSVAVPDRVARVFRRGRLPPSCSTPLRPIS